MPPTPLSLAPTPVSAGWEPLPDEIADWMGMKPYVIEEREQRSA